jgi:hypothetical protein
MTTVESQSDWLAMQSVHAAKWCLVIMLAHACCAQHTTATPARPAQPNLCFGKIYEVTMHAPEPPFTTHLQSSRT